MPLVLVCKVCGLEASRNSAAPLIEFFESLCFGFRDPGIPPCHLVFNSLKFVSVARQGHGLVIQFTEGL